MMIDGGVETSTSQSQTQTQTQIQSQDRDQNRDDDHHDRDDDDHHDRDDDHHHNLRLIDLVRPVEALGARVIALQIDCFHTQLQQFVKILSKRPLGDLQLADRHKVCREAVIGALEIPRKLLQAWAGPPKLMPGPVRRSVAGKFLDILCRVLIRGIFQAEDISLECARRLTNLLCDVIAVVEGTYTADVDGRQEESLQGYVQNYSRVKEVVLLLDEDQTLSSVANDVNERRCYVSLRPSEISGMVKAIWRESEKREALLKLLQMQQARPT